MLSVSLGVELPPKTEITKTVADVFSIIFFNTFKYMRVVPDHKIRTFIDSKMCESLLVFIRCILLFDSPVEIHDDDLCTGFFQGFDILLHLRCAFLMVCKFIDSGDTDFYTFYL